MLTVTYFFRRGEQGKTSLFGRRARKGTGGPLGANIKIESWSRGLGYRVDYSTPGYHPPRKESDGKDREDLN